MLSNILAQGIAAGPIAAMASALISNGKSSFANVMQPTQSASLPSTAATVTVIIVLIIIFILWVLTVIGVYRITDSKSQAGLYCVFGSIYLLLAVLYYGFSGYKFCKVK